MTSKKKKSALELLPLFLLLIFATDEVKLKNRIKLEERTGESFAIDFDFTTEELEQFENLELSSPDKTPDLQDFSVQVTKKILSDESIGSARSFEVDDSRSRSATRYKTSNMIEGEKMSRMHTKKLDELKQKNTKTCACVSKLAKSSKIVRRLATLVQYCYLMLLAFLKTMVDYTLAAGEMVNDLTVLFIGAVLAIFVETNWKGMLQKLALKVETFYKKDLKYKLKVVSAGALFALVFGSFYLFAWDDVQEYISQLKNPIHKKDHTEFLKSFALVTFLHILKVIITAIMPLFAGAFGVLTSIMFPLSAVFVSTLFSGVGLGFWYLLKKLTKVDVIGLIGDNTACGPLEYLLADRWRLDKGGMTKDQFDALKADYLRKYEPKKGLKLFREEIALPVTYKGEKGEESALVKSERLCKSMIFFRVLFPGIGDSLLNTYVMRYGVGFPELFISLWLGLPENAFMSYALQVVKHPWISVLLMIFLGGLATTTWIGKYIYVHKRKPERKEDCQYHPKKYDLYKKLLNLFIYVILFLVTFNIREILPLDVFELDAYYTNKAAANCTMSGEYADIYEKYGLFCDSTATERNMNMAWGVGFMGFVTILSLLQTIRNSFPWFKNSNFDKADDFKYKCKLADYNGKKNKLSRDSDLIQERFNLNKNQSTEKDLEMKLNEIDEVILSAENKKKRAALDQKHEKDAKMQEQFEEIKENFGDIVKNAGELKNEIDAELDGKKLNKI